jgi:uncharacterized protein (TIGR00730 family)
MTQLEHFNQRCIAVFCGSASGDHAIYRDTAIEVGHALAVAGHNIVYGGGSVGLMGALAQGCLAAKGEITGVMPKALVDREIAHTGLTNLILTKDMHDRKTTMAERADAFIVLPGGTGTLEEFFEQWTWSQIGYHEKPIGLLNVRGFFDPLSAMIDHMMQTGFLSTPHRNMLLCAPRLQGLLEGFARYTSPPLKEYAKSNDP